MCATGSVCVLQASSDSFGFVAGYPDGLHKRRENWDEALRGSVGGGDI